MQLFWGEPLAAVADRIDTLRSLQVDVGRVHRPLAFGLRVTTVVRDTTEEAWAVARARVAAMALSPTSSGGWAEAVGQQRLRRLADRSEVVDEYLYTAPALAGGIGAGASWLVGSPDDVAGALCRYADLGISTFILSDTPYRDEITRQGSDLLPLLRGLR
nr:LLM class flavin-dependent oxidoreductase [Nakamurella alba]